MDCRWNEWNVAHVARHGVTPEEAEEALSETRAPFPRRTGGDEWLTWAPARSGRLLQVVFVLDRRECVFVIHARPLTERERRLFRRRRKW